MTKTTTNISELFVSFISEGQKAASLIVDNKDKAVAYAALAQACAQSGLVSPTVTAVAAPTKEEVIAAYKEPEQTQEVVTVASTETPAPEAAPEVTPDPEPAPAQEAPQEAPQEEVETEVWTPFMQQKYAKELTFIQEQKGVFGVDALNATLAQFSVNQLNNIEADITPLNIAGFVSYLEQLIARLQQG